MVTIPHGGWLPRHHQMPLWDYLRDGGKRAIAIWHRRAGKDEVAMHFAAYSAATRRGNYLHMLPEFNHGRRVIWNAVNPHTGRRRIDEAFPPEWRTNTNDTEMFMRLANGSTWQVVGSDRYDGLVGASAAGVTFSEYALSNPSAWGYLRPMLEENDGWAMFITTPRGHNHAKALYDHACQTPGWFAELLTARDTGMLTEKQLDEALFEYSALYGADVGRAQFQQEYECSFNAAILGAFYALEMKDVRDEGRVLPVEPLLDRPVMRAWDIGVGDDTSIWWFQAVGAQLFVLDHYASSGVGLEHYRDVIAEREAERGWLHGTDWVPHDAKVKEWGSGKTRIETMQYLGLSPMLVPAASLDDGINALRRVLPLCVFHPRCEVGGLNALEQYRREWDDEKKCFRASAVHDWCLTGETEVLTRYGACLISDLPQTGEVLTPCGWKQYHSPRVTRRNAQLVEVRFADGLTVRCTPDHLFKTESGWASAECLTSTTPIQSCLTTSRSISMAGCIVFSRLRCITRAVVESFIGKLGWALSGRSLMGATFTTVTATSRTTASSTWSAFPQKSTWQMSGSCEGRVATCPDFPSKPARLRLTGISRQPACSGTNATPSDSVGGPSGSANRWLVQPVARFFKHWSARVGNLRFIAATTVRSKTIAVASVRPLVEREDVWCLTVPGAECFALVNGAVTHNCSHPADAARYMALAYRPPPPRVIRSPPKVGWHIPPPDEEYRGGLRL